MNEKIFSRDIVLLLTASFFYMANPMPVTPMITGFSKQPGAGAAGMGLAGRLANLCCLFFQPFSGNLAGASLRIDICF